MHHAPSVTYPVGRCAFWMVLLFLAGVALSGVLALAWHGLSAWQRCLLVAAVAAWGALALRSAWRQPQGRLRCQGAGALDPGWTWEDAVSGAQTPLQALQVVLDLQVRMLVRLTAQGPAPRWAWVSASQAPSDWLAWRRAVIAAAQRPVLTVDPMKSNPSGIVPRA